MKKCILETIGKIQMFFVLLELKIQRRWPIHIQITIWGLISMIFVFFLSYLEIFSIPLIKVFNILGFNDMPAGNSEGFFSFIISRFLYCSVDVSVWFIIPLLITLYYFYYRQQRAISESYLTRNDISVLKLGLSVFLAILAIYINNIKGVTTIGTVVVCLGAIIWSGLFVKFVFNHLFSLKRCEKEEVVTAFSGLLELSRRNKVLTNQEELFGDISVEKNNDKIA